MPTLMEMMEAVSKQASAPPKASGPGSLAAKVPAFWAPGMAANSIDLGCKVYDVISGLKDIVEGAAMVGRSFSAAKVGFDAARGAAGAGGFALQGTIGALAIDLLGPLGAWVQVWIGLGGPYIEAKQYIADTEGRSGVSRGIVTGASGVSGQMVRERLGRDFQPKNPWDESNTALAKNSYNFALIAGFVEGRRLSIEQRKVFWRALGSKMKNISTYSDPARWTRDEWISFYIDAATTYQRNYMS